MAAKGIPNFEPGDLVELFYPFSRLDGLRMRVIKSRGPCQIEIFGKPVIFKNSYQVEITEEEIKYIQEEVNPDFKVPDEEIIFPDALLYYTKPEKKIYTKHMEETRKKSCPEQFIEDISKIDSEAANTLSKLLFNSKENH